MSAPTIGAVCPYLLAADGGWRAAAPSRAHRCTAVAPPAPLAPDKQRRLCLVPDHAGCATYRAALADAAPEGAGSIHRSARAPLRTFARTTPLVLDHGRMALAMPVLGPERGVGQIGLIALMGVALVAIVFARVPGLGDGTPSSDGRAPEASVIALPSITPTPVPTEPSESTPSEAPVRTLVPTEVEPTAAPSTDPGPTEAPEASAAATYKVRRGDTLSGIAGEFGTTWQILAKLNGIDDPGRLRVGQVLILP